MPSFSRDESAAWQPGITVAEIDGALLEVPPDRVAAERQLLEYHQSKGVFYPLIQVECAGSEAEAKDTSAPKGQSGKKEDGILDEDKTSLCLSAAVAVFLFFYYSSTGSGSAWNGAIAAVIFAAFVAYTKFRFIGARSRFLSKPVLRAMMLESEDTESQESSDGRVQPVKAFGWHQYLNRFAVSLQKGNTDFVVMYDMDREAWLPTVLKHQLQRQITCLHFQPNAGGCLAVGCHAGVMLWKMEPSSDAGTSSRESNMRADANGVGGDARLTPEAAWVALLAMRGFERVSSMSWSACGRFLAVGYESSDCAVVWDASSREGTVLESFVPLSSLGVNGGGVRLVQWAPTGKVLVVSLAINLFALYETASWTWERHRTDGRLRAACFSPNGRYLLGAVQDKLWSYTLQGRHTEISNYQRVELAMRADGEAGGEITGLAWSAGGERLAVKFKSEDGAQHPLALFLTECDGQSNNIRAVFRGFINGPPQAKKDTDNSPALPAGSPGHVEFRRTFRRSQGRNQQPRPDGALFSVCWENGRISNYPLYFASLDGEQNKPPILSRQDLRW